MNLDDIVKLWHKTQMGDMKECVKNQVIFADIMWKLYERLKEKKEKKMINICDECKMSMMDHTDCESCKEPMCEDEDKIDKPEGWYHPDCHSDIYG